MGQRRRADRRSVCTPQFAAWSASRCPLAFCRCHCSSGFLKQGVSLLRSSCRKAERPWAGQGLARATRAAGHGDRRSHHEADNDPQASRPAAVAPVLEGTELLGRVAAPAPQQQTARSRSPQRAGVRSSWVVAAGRQFSISSAARKTPQPTNSGATSQPGLRAKPTGEL